MGKIVVLEQGQRQMLNMQALKFNWEIFKVRKMKCFLFK